MLDDKSLPNLQKSLPEIMDKVNNEEKEFNERVAIFESEKNQESAASEKKRRNDLLAERAKKVDELKSTIFVDENKKSIVEQQVEKCASNPPVTGECEIFNLMD